MREKILIIFIWAAILFPFALTLAANGAEYTVLAPLPGIPAKLSGNILGQYVPAVFTLAIGLSAAAAVIMIVIGGVQYITTDAIQGKSQGKDRIKNAVIGLVLVISAWIILYTVNPKLLKINLSIEPVKIETPAGGELVGELQPSMVAIRSDIMKECNCNFQVTSLTSGAHDPNSKHYKGLAVDVAPDPGLNKYLGVTNPQKCLTITKSIGNNTAKFLWEPKGETCGGKVPSSGDHWHVEAM